jgi:hypothetical protein
MAFERTCDDCGTPYVAERKTSKFCSVACRVRANRRPSKTGAAVSGAKVTTTATSPSAPPDDPEPDGVLAAQVRSTLTALGALDTIPGAAALRVARQIDKGDDSGSAVATLSKELSRLVAEAKAEAAPKIKDGADAIMDRVGNKLLQLVS